MKICTVCDYTTKFGPVTDSMYCPSCGNQLKLSSSVSEYISPVAAPRLIRFGAGLLDCLISLVFLAIASLPFLGILAAPLDCLFWLLRDIKGASAGKALLGLEVRTTGGGNPTKASLILRNLPFAPLIIQVIPFFGNVVLPVMGIVVILEAILILLTERRIGDYLAGTKVTKKSSGRMRVNSAAAGNY